MRESFKRSKSGLKVLCLALICFFSSSRAFAASSALCDYDGDSASDLAVFSESTGEWYITGLEGEAILFGAAWGSSGFCAVPGDYNGDGTNDLAVYNSSSGLWFIGSLDAQIILQAFPWGGPNMQPVPGDYDGDGRYDLAVHDLDSGGWYVVAATGAMIAAPEFWGGRGMTPVPGDYDGDGIADLAVWHDGFWYVRSMDGRLLAWAFPWGGRDMTPVPGDYDGDGACDFAVYHEASGAWYAVTRAGKLLLWNRQWGGVGLLPVPGDYNGDGRSDLAVYLEAAGLWFILSADGSLIAWAKPWGGPGLAPVQLLPTNNSVVSPDLGVNASLRGRRCFPDDNAWNQRIDQAPVDPNSDALIASIGRDEPLHPDFGAEWDGGPFGLPYLVVSGSEARVKITYTEYGDESDPGPFPIPLSAPIEPGNDRHVLVLDRDNWMLYELYHARPTAGGWLAGSGARFDLNSNALRPAGWTSADAAGLPIFPGLVRYDEVYEQGEIRHALRFTCSRTRRAYVHPARHYASSDTSPNLPPMGMRVRLKASVDISGFPEAAQVILRCLKTYGMFVADNGSDWFVSGVADSRWDDEVLNTLKELKGSDFEVVKMGTIVTD